MAMTGDRDAVRPLRHEVRAHVLAVGACGGCVCVDGLCGHVREQGGEHGAPAAGAHLRSSASPRGQVPLRPPFLLQGLVLNQPLRCFRSPLVLLLFSCATLIVGTYTHSLSLTHPHTHTHTYTQDGRRKLSTHGGVHFFDVSHTHTYTHTHTHIQEGRRKLSTHGGVHLFDVSHTHTRTSMRKVRGS